MERRQAEDAMDSLDGRQYDGREIRIEMARSSRWVVGCSCSWQGESLVLSLWGAELSYIVLSSPGTVTGPGLGTWGTVAGATDAGRGARTGARTGTGGTAATPETTGESLYTVTLSSAHINNFTGGVVTALVVWDAASPCWRPKPRCTRLSSRFSNCTSTSRLSQAQAEAQMFQAVVWKLKQLNKK